MLMHDKNNPIRIATSGGADGRTADNVCWYCCTADVRGMVPMMISTGTFKSNAGPDGSTTNQRKMNEVPFWYICKSKASSLVTGCVNTKFTMRKPNTVIDIYNMTLEYYKHKKQMTVEE